MDQARSTQEQSPVGTEASQAPAAAASAITRTNWTADTGLLRRARGQTTERRSTLARAPTAAPESLGLSPPPRRPRPRWRGEDGQPSRCGDDRGSRPEPDAA